MALLFLREEWKFVQMVCGAQFVTISGDSWMLKSYADN